MYNLSKQIIMIDIQKAFERFNWRFRKEKGEYLNFKPKDYDIECMNTIIQWCMDATKQNIQNNQLFAKLYIYHFNKHIAFHDSTIFDSIPQKELSELLDKPLDLYYKAFHRDLHHNQIYKIAKELLKNEDLEKLDLVEELKEKYTLEDVTQRLDYMVNEALLRFS